VPLEIPPAVGRFDLAQLDDTPPHDPPNHPSDCGDPNCGLRARPPQRSLAGLQVILQVVGKRVDIEVGDEWNGSEPRTRIVAIGAHDGVDAPSIDFYAEQLMHAGSENTSGLCVMRVSSAIAFAMPSSSRKIGGKPQRIADKVSSRYR